MVGKVRQKAGHRQQFMVTGLCGGGTAFFTVIQDAGRQEKATANVPPNQRLVFYNPLCRSRKLCLKGEGETGINSPATTHFLSLEPASRCFLRFFPSSSFRFSLLKFVLVCSFFFKSLIYHYLLFISAQYFSFYAF